MRFDEKKRDTLNLRVASAFNAALRGIAERENRSLVNALEWLVLDYYEGRHMPWPAGADRAKRKTARAQEAVGRKTTAGRKHARGAVGV
jgi:hypothetical protein